MTSSGRLSHLFLGVAFMAAWFYLFGTATLRPLPARVQVIAPADMVADSDHAYHATVTLSARWPLMIGIDSAVEPWGSSLELYENDRKLGPPHTQYGTIASLGSGRYSHWIAANVVYFSASDNTDPRSNGRTYTISAQPQLSSWLFVLTVLPGSVLILHHLLSPWLRAATIGLAGTALIAWVGMFFGHLALSPDSTTYTEWRALVPLGYPLFLSGIKTLFGTLVWASVIQVSLAVAACSFVAFAVARISGRMAAGFATLFVLLCYPPMFSFEGQLLSEALFVPLLLTNVGAAICLIADWKIRHAILLALTAALIMFVRPAGYFAPCGVIFLAIASASRFRWVVKWAIAPMIAFIIATILVNVAIRGNASPSQVGRNVFPHVAFLFDPDRVTGPDREYAIAIDEALTPFRAAYRNANTLVERFMYSMNTFNSRLLATDKATYARLQAENRPDAQSDAENYRRLEAIYVRLFLNALRGNPADYVRLVRDQIVGGWEISVLRDDGPFAQTHVSTANDNYADAVKTIRAWKLPVAEAALLPNTAAIEGFPGRFIEFFEIQYRRIRAQRWLIYLVGAVTFLAMPIAILAGRRSRHWLALGYCGAIIHGSILLTTTVTVFIPRYALPIDPVILVSGVILMDGLLYWGWRSVSGLTHRNRLAPRAA